MALPTLGDNNDNNEKEKSSLGLPSMEDFDEDIEEDVEDEDSFQTVDLEETYEDEDEDYMNEDLYDNEEEERELPSMREEMYYEGEDDYNPDYEEDFKKGKEKKFIDKKNKKLIPFGGKKSKKNKKSIKSSDFDDRKNLLAKTKIIRFIIMSIIVIIFLMGLKNTFLPSHVYTDEQIRNFARQGAGQTGFPRERGESFVEGFMESYLTFDRSKPELNDILSYYYGEDNFSKVGYEKMNMRLGTDAKQHIIVGPTIYDVQLLTEYSASFKVSAYVSDTTGEVTDGRSSSGRWLSFSVNVYYDEEMDTLSITQDSPTIIPTYRIGKQSDVPKRAPFGNGEVNTEIGPAINPTINGFIEAFAQASISSHESILQYISDKNDINLYDGFGGSVELNGSPETAIKRTIYNNDDGVYRVDLTVNWVDKKASGNDNKVEYVGKYIMRVKPEGDGKYTVSSFVPYTYYTR